MNIRNWPKKSRENWPKNKLPGLMKARGMICPIGALEARTAPTLEQGPISVPDVLHTLYHTLVRRDKFLSAKERDDVIRDQYRAGVSQADLARQFGISYQRVHQIVRAEQGNRKRVD